MREDSMNSFVEIFQGLPVVLLISIIFGLTALLRIYIMKVPGIRRLSTQDRRQSRVISSFPFHDSRNELISEDRRKLLNRRLASYVILNYSKSHNM
jgi:hypothetical protein